MKKIFVIIPGVITLTALVSLSMPNYVHADERYVAFAKSDFATSGNKNWHGGECYCLILETIRGTSLDVDSNGVKGVTIETSGYNAIWHDALTGMDISCNDNFEFTVKRKGELVATAKIEEGNKFVIRSKVLLSELERAEAKREFQEDEAKREKEHQAHKRELAEAEVKQNEQRFHEERKHTKAYARGYADGKLWAEENDVPDKKTKQYYQTVLFGRVAHEHSGEACTPEEIRAWGNYAQGWADAVFGEDDPPPPVAVATLRDHPLGPAPTNVGVPTPAPTPVAVATPAPTPDSDNVTNEKAAPVSAETPETQRAAYTEADNELNPPVLLAEPASPTPTPQPTPISNLDPKRRTWPDGRILKHPDRFIPTWVVKVAPNDTLKLRSGPGTRFGAITEIPADAADIFAFDKDAVWDGDTWWYPIEWHGLHGYVGGSHLPHDK